MTGVLLKDGFADNGFDSMKPPEGGGQSSGALLLKAAVRRARESGVALRWRDSQIERIRRG